MLHQSISGITGRAFKVILKIIGRGGLVQMFFILPTTVNQPSSANIYALNTKTVGPSETHIIYMYIEDKNTDIRHCYSLTFKKRGNYSLGLINEAPHHNDV
jgi:hypothetical protein